MPFEQRDNSEGLSLSNQENATSGLVVRTTSCSITNNENNASNYAIKEFNVKTKSDNKYDGGYDHCNENNNSNEQTCLPKSKSVDGNNSK